MNAAPAADVMSDDLYFVDPDLIEVLEGQDRPRKRTQKEIVEMAVSLHTHGQCRAVECYRDETGRWVLGHGYVRTLAARLIRSGFKFTHPETGGEVRVKDKKFKLWVVISNPGHDGL